MLTVKTFPVNPLGENTYVVSLDTGEALIIDCGAFTPAEKQTIADYIAQHNLHPKAHVLTHTHFDHCLGAAFIHERYGLLPRFHEADSRLYRMLPQQMDTLMGGELTCPIVPHGELLTDNSTLELGTATFRVIPCPGHTPGGICLYCEEERILFSGDSLFQLSIGRTDLPGGNHWQLIRSLHRLIRSLPDDTTIYPGHGVRTSAAIERQYNPYLDGG